jgi:hypothetical protein
MGLCCTKEQVVPPLDLSNLNREAELSVPYQDTWIEGELVEATSGNTILVTVDFGTPVTISLKVKGIATPRSSPDRARKELQDRFPVKVKVKPLSWEREGIEMFAEVKKRSMEHMESIMSSDALFN